MTNGPKPEPPSNPEPRSVAPYREPSPRDNYSIAKGARVRLPRPAYPIDPTSNVAWVLGPHPTLRGFWNLTLGCWCCPVPAYPEEDLVRLDDVV